MTHQIEIRATEAPKIHASESRRVTVGVETDCIIPVQGSEWGDNQTVEKLRVQWVRSGGGQWKLGLVDIRGHLARKMDGFVDRRYPRESFYSFGVGAPQWVLDFIEQYRPADTNAGA